jgi:hypothetical protein
MAAQPFRCGTGDADAVAIVVSGDSPSASIAATPTAARDLLVLATTWVADRTETRVGVAVLRMCKSCDHIRNYGSTTRQLPMSSCACVVLNARCVNFHGLRGGHRGVGKTASSRRGSLFDAK